VDPYGQLQMCQLSRRSSFDLGTETFERGWNEHFPLLRARKWQTQSICRTCNLISLCGSCPGASEMEGDIEGIVPQFCEIAHIRAWTVMGEDCGHLRDATCCLGRGALAEKEPEDVARLTQGGCGSCGHAEPAKPAVIQIQRPVLR
jgi:radical SAM protein with 4Fe4S-binding SPASM domain